MPRPGLLAHQTVPAPQEPRQERRNIRGPHPLRHQRRLDVPRRLDHRRGRAHILLRNAKRPFGQRHADHFQQPTHGIVLRLRRV